MTDDHAARAAAIAPCTCSGRTQKMIDGDYHFAGCWSELRDDIAAALADVERETVERCAKVADDLAKRARGHEVYPLSSLKVVADNSNYLAGLVRALAAPTPISAYTPSPAESRSAAPAATRRAWCGR